MAGLQQNIKKIVISNSRNQIEQSKVGNEYIHLKQQKHIMWAWNGAVRLDRPVIHKQIMSFKNPFKEKILRSLLLAIKRRGCNQSSWQKFYKILEENGNAHGRNEQKIERKHAFRNRPKCAIC